VFKTIQERKYSFRSTVLEIFRNTDDSRCFSTRSPPGNGLIVLPSCPSCPRELSGWLCKQDIPTKKHHPTTPPCGLGVISRTMDITRFIVSGRDEALLYGDYSTYRAQLSRRLLSARKKLGQATRKGAKYAKRPAVTAEDIASNHE
jgi:hypothetical protein